MTEYTKEEAVAMLTKVATPDDNLLSHGCSIHHDTLHALVNLAAKRAREADEKRLPEVLFDGTRVWEECRPEVSTSQVSKVLDVVVRLARKDIRTTIEESKS